VGGFQTVSGFLIGEIYFLRLRVRDLERAWEPPRAESATAAFFYFKEVKMIDIEEIKKSKDVSLELVELVAKIKTVSYALEDDREMNKQYLKPDAFYIGCSLFLREVAEDLDKIRNALED
jgi:hypothetical protein